MRWLGRVRGVSFSKVFLKLLPTPENKKKIKFIILLLRILLKINFEVEWKLHQETSGCFGKGLDERKMSTIIWTVLYKNGL